MFLAEEKARAIAQTSEERYVKLLPQATMLHDVTSQSKRSTSVTTGTGGCS